MSNTTVFCRRFADISKIIVAVPIRPQPTLCFHPYTGVAFIWFRDIPVTIWDWGAILPQPAASSYTLWTRSAWAWRLVVRSDPSIHITCILRYSAAVTTGQSNQNGSRVVFHQCKELTACERSHLRPHSEYWPALLWGPGKHLWPLARLLETRAKCSTSSQKAAMSLDSRDLTKQTNYFSNFFKRINFDKSLFNSYLFV